MKYLKKVCRTAAGQGVNSIRTVRKPRGSYRHKQHELVALDFFLLKAKIHEGTEQPYAS
jgi:hypothetical protein